MNKSVLISNLAVIRKELVKAEAEIGREYATVLSSTKKSEISKEEFYLENAMTLLLDAIQTIEVIGDLLENETPESIVKLAEESNQDYKELSVGMKEVIVKHKLKEDPMLGLLASLHALSQLVK